MMLRPRFNARRSPIEWVVRAALAAGAAWMGYGAVTQTFAYIIRGKAPERAHLLAPNDGRITALLSEQRSGVEATAQERVRADGTARLALRQDATAVSAASTLGINASIQGKDQDARYWFGYAQRLSRRDLRSQLWAIEDAVARNDIPSALRHYDIALRTSRIAPDLLFPVLSAAITAPEIRSALIRTLAARPIWATGFFGYVAVHGPNPQATAQLYKAFRAGNGISDDARAVVIDRLIVGRHFDDAWALYAATHPNIDRRRSRDPQFTANLTAPSTFDWNAMNDGGVSASIQPTKGGGVAVFDAPQAVGGMALRQAQMLPPGNYSLQGRSSDVALHTGSKPYWALSCIDGRLLGQIDLPNSTQAGGHFGGRFTVPAGCPLQYLSLILRPNDAIDGVRGQIDMVRLTPAG